MLVFMGNYEGSLSSMQRKNRYILKIGKPFKIGKKFSSYKECYLKLNSRHQDMVCYKESIQPYDHFRT